MNLASPSSDVVSVASAALSQLDKRSISGQDYASPRFNMSTTTQHKHPRRPLMLAENTS